MNQQNIKKYVLLALVIVLAGVFYNNTISSDDKLKPSKKEVSVEKTEKIKRYYVVVSRLDSEKDNITKAELIEFMGKNQVYILEKDKADLEKYTGSDIKNTASDTERWSLGTGVGVLAVADLDPKYKVLNFEGKSIWENEDYLFFVEAVKEDTDPSSHKASKDKEEKFDRSKVIVLTSVGDIMLSRTVYMKMTELGYASPFSGISERLKSADITFGNLETSVSNLVPPSTSGMLFVAPSKSLEGVKLSGFDILNLANNHSTNFGLKAYADLLNILKANNIVYVGGGANEAEAKNYKTVESKGKKLAFLGVNTIVGDSAATASNPGNWKISLAPWGKANQTEIDEVLAVIKKAKKENDFVIVMPHWGTEYTHDPNGDMKTLAHQMIDAGADLIVGTHPHWTQGVEKYKNGFIAYSLGNFIFDQEWSLETKQGLIMDAYFYGDKLVNVALTPVLIEDFHRPRILNKTEGKSAMDAVWESTRKIGD